MITPGELHAAEASSVTPSISDLQSVDFASSEGGNALSVIKSVGSSSEAAQSVGSMQVAVEADLNASALPSVESGVMQGFWENSANFITMIYRQPVGIAMRCGCVAVGIGVSTGAGFGYHYLSNFILEDLPSILHGRKF